MLEGKELKDQLKKITPIALLIWERDELRLRYKEKYKNSDWIIKLNKQIGKLSDVIKDNDLLENELIKLAAKCLVWVEQIRKEKSKE